MSNLRRPRTSVSEVIADRHSIHSFTSKSVPKDILEKVFSIAQNSASNSNLQPWEVKVVAGEKLKTIQAKMVKLYKAGTPPALPRVPPKFHDRQREQGATLWGKGFQIPRDDAAALWEKRVLNFEDYGASTVALICVDKSFTSLPDIASVGIYLENLILLLWENGIGTCPQASITGYPQVWEEELRLSGDLNIVCGLAMGYPDEEANVVTIRMPKRGWREAVTFFE